MGARLLALGALLLTTWASAAEDVSVSARASKTEVQVGERITVELHVKGPAGATLMFPKQAGNPEVELREAAVAEGTPPAGVHRYEAVAYTVADAAIPKIRVDYRLPDGTAGMVETEPIPLRVLSVLPKDPKDQKLIDIRGPVELFVGGAFWVMLAALALLATGLVVWFRRRRRRTAPAAPPAPPAPPDVEALQALERLERAGYLERGEYRGFYIALLDLAKRYLERRLGAPVLEMTSAEMAAFLRDHPAAAPLTGRLREMAGAADAVKFARGPGLTDEALRHLTAAREVIRGLEDRLRPPPEEKVA